MPFSSYGRFFDRSRNSLNAITQWVVPREGGDRDDSRVRDRISSQMAR